MSASCEDSGELTCGATAVCRAWFRARLFLLSDDPTAEPAGVDNTSRKLSGYPRSSRCDEAVSAMMVYGVIAGWRWRIERRGKRRQDRGECKRGASLCLEEMVGANCLSLRFRHSKKAPAAIRALAQTATTTSTAVTSELSFLFGGDGAIAEEDVEVACEVASLFVEVLRPWWSVGVVGAVEAVIEGIGMVLEEVGAIVCEDSAKLVGMMLVEA